MTDYLMTNASRVSTITPSAGILTDMTDDGTILYRKDQAVTQFGIQVVHEWITATQRDAILADIVTNGYADRTFTLHGVPFIGTLVNEPAMIERRGALYTYESKFIGVQNTASYLLLETGDKLILEDASGFLVIEG